MAPHVVCIGEALVEMVRPELDLPHDRLGSYQGPFPSGAPAIFASSAARLGSAHGLTVGFLGAVGRDAFGDVFREKLRIDGLDTSGLLQRDGQATGIAFVQLNRDGSRSFVFSRGAAADLPSDTVRPEYFANVRAVHLSGSSLALDARLRESCWRALELGLASNPRCLVSFDPNFRVEMAGAAETRELARRALEHVTHLLPSGDELAFVMGERDWRAGAERAFATCPRLEVIVLKRGAAGCLLLTRSSLESGGSAIPGVPAEERYPTGAGDNFGGAFLVGVLAGLPLESAAHHACAAGALAVEERGLMKTFGWSEVAARAAQEASHT
jgi:fructokinase